MLAAKLALLALLAAGDPAAEPPPTATHASTSLLARAGDFVTGLTPRALLQPRLDVGDLLVTRDGDRYALAQDLSLRRVRVGATATIAHTLRFGITFDADRAGQAGRSTAARLKDATLEWRADGDDLAVRVGKAKLPYTRIGLTSSRTQLLVDRPAFIEAARDLFDSFTPLNVLVRARGLGGAITAHAAIADGWEAGAKLYGTGTGRTVRSSLPLGVLRVELAPPGWVERRRMDAHLGEGRHLQLGLSLAGQGKIAYEEVAARESRAYLGADASFHLGAFTAQAEAGWSRIRSTLAERGEVRSRGVYVQAGWLLARWGLEPAARWEWWDRSTAIAGDAQQALTAGVNAYLAGHALKLGLNGVHRWFGPASAGRLRSDRTQDVVILQGQLEL
jgi:hypothetical protein